MLRGMLSLPLKIHWTIYSSIQMYYLPICDEVPNNGVEKKITVWESSLKTFIEFRKHRKNAELVQLSKTQAVDVHE